MSIKKIIAVACLCFTAASLPLSEKIMPEKAFYASAADTFSTYEEDNILYNIFSDHVEVSWHDGWLDGVDVVIPDTIQGLPVTKIEPSAFKESKITSVVIPDSVTEIGKIAFYSCEKLTTVKIGKGVTDIGKDAFNYCTSLKSIEIPDNVQNIGDGLFSLCDSLEEVKLSENIENIGTAMFSRCTSLKSIAIPDSVKKLLGVRL